MKRFRISFLFSFIFLVSNTSTLAQTGEEYFNKGVAQGQKKQYYAAIDNFNKAISNNYNIAYSYLFIGQCYSHLGKYESAIQNMLLAEKKDPSMASAQRWIASTYYHLNKQDSGLIHINNAIKLDPQAADGFYIRGYFNLYHKNLEESLTDFNKAIQLDPASTQYYLGRCNLYLNQEKYDNAIEDLNTLISIHPQSYDAYNYRASVYLFLGKYANSIYDYEKAIDIDKNKEKSIAIINILTPLARLKRFEEAAKYYSTYQTNYTKDPLEITRRAYPEPYIEAITQSIPKKEYQSAFKKIVEAEKLHTSNEEVTDFSFNPLSKKALSNILSLKGYVLSKLNKPNEASQAYEQSLLINNLQPDIEEALELLTNKTSVDILSDKTAPSLKILEPSANNRSVIIDDGNQTSNKKQIRGIATDESGIRNIQINNKAVAHEANGYFEVTVPITEGDNLFNIVVTDNNANSYSELIQLKTRGVKIPNSDINKEYPQIQEDIVYHAILIAENEYADNKLDDLSGPSSDMEKIYQILIKNYSFLPQNISKLINKGKNDILETIVTKTNSLSAKDNVLIFYAGHGIMIKQPDGKEEGFLIPSDATKGKEFTYLRGEELVNAFKYSKARHILIMADACFAGSLFRSAENEIPASVEEAFKEPSRKLMASGNRTIVPDTSPFIAHLQTALLNNRKKYITAEQLLNTFKDQYINSTHLNLQYYPIAGLDLGGQFVFKRK